MPTYKKGDLYLASIVHVKRGPKEHPETVAIQPGQMVSETDLSAQEIEGLVKRGKGALRPPSFEEIQAMDAREETKAAADAVRTAEEQQTTLAIEQKAEKDRVEAEQRAKADKARAELEADQAKEREAAAAKATKAVAGAGKKK